MAEASGERTSGFCMIYASGGMALSMGERVGVNGMKGLKMASLVRLGAGTMSKLGLAHERQ